MSGSGGGGGGGGGGVLSGGATSCANLVIRTTLNSPKADVLGGLKVGDRLKVEFTPPRGPIVAKAGGGRIAGSITPAEMQILIKCLSDGFTYEAEVKAVNGGRCDVEIRAKR